MFQSVKKLVAITLIATTTHLGFVGAVQAAMVDTGAAAPATALDPYGQLVRMLLPRAQSLAVYGLGGRPLWVAEGQDDPDLQRLAAELTAANAGSAFEIDGRAVAFDGATAYGFRLRDGQGVPLAAVALLMREGGDARPFSLVLGLVRMDADRAEHVGGAFGDLAHVFERRQFRADGEHRFHARRARTRQHARKILLQFRIVEMAMGVDEDHFFFGPSPAVGADGST